MGQRWADEQTLRWPIQDLQPWANRAASDGPMKGQCIRAIWDTTITSLDKTWYIINSCQDSRFVFVRQKNDYNTQEEEAENTSEVCLSCVVVKLLAL